FSQPLLFFTRKKYQKVGVVYHSVTKVPLDLVMVRAYNVQTNRLVKTVVSNEKGEFFLRISEEGTYRLQAVKQGFIFPSTYLGDVKEDGLYVDVYAGQDIVLTKDAEPLTVSLPLDPVASAVPAQVLKWARTKRRIAFVLSPLSVFASLGIFVVYMSVFTGVVLAAQILLYALTWRITHKKRNQTWGIVYDEATRRPVGNVVIRLFEPKYNKLVDSLISDANGRYVFALGPNEYYVTFAKDGYLEATVKPVDFTSRKDISLFGINLPLRRNNGTAHE
ncbi:MAG: carboxypeptidase-like regulatory domain-containing protein, partial [Patescibacteria group bacterium]